MWGGNVHGSEVHGQEPDKKRVWGITSGCTGSPINLAPGELGDKPPSAAYRERRLKNSH